MMFLLLLGYLFIVAVVNSHDPDKEAEEFIARHGDVMPNKTVKTDPYSFELEHYPKEEDMQDQHEQVWKKKCYYHGSPSRNGTCEERKDCIAKGGICFQDNSNPERIREDGFYCGGSGRKSMKRGIGYGIKFCCCSNPESSDSP